MMKNYKLLFSAVLLTAFTACQTNTSHESNDAQEATEEALEMSPSEALAAQYGIENFSTIDTVNFTFNVRPGAEADTVSRDWMWLPKTQEVSLNLNGQWVTYKRDTIQSEQFKGMDAAFINDQYWLLFPFRTLWDSGTKITEGNDVIPFGTDSVATLSIAYTDSTGYTPHDTYKLFMNRDGWIAAWEYYPGSAEQAAITTSWEDTKTYKGVKIPTKFINEENGFAVFFTGIELK